RPPRSRSQSIGLSQFSRAPWTAVARNQLLTIGVVVVGELFARFYVPAGANPDVVPHDMAVAVRPARMVDETCDVAADLCIAHPAPVHGEAPDLAAFQILRFTPEALLVADQLAFVGDDAGVLVDRLKREYTPAMQLRSSPLDARQLHIPVHA